MRDKVLEKMREIDFSVFIESPPPDDVLFDVLENNLVNDKGIVGKYWRSLDFKDRNSLMQEYLDNGR